MGEFNYSQTRDISNEKPPLSLYHIFNEICDSVFASVLQFPLAARLRLSFPSAAADQA
jgi:hypothetical protein